MYVIQCYDDKGKNRGKFAGVQDGYVEVNHKVLCSVRFHDKASAEACKEYLSEWGGEEFEFKITKVREA